MLTARFLELENPLPYDFIIIKTYNPIIYAQCELSLLQTELSELESFVEGASEKSDYLGEAYKNWESQVRCNAYDVEDIIESAVANEYFLRQSKFYLCRKYVRRRDLALKIRAFRELKFKPLLDIARVQFANLRIESMSVTNTIMEGEVTQYAGNDKARWRNFVIGLDYEKSTILKYVTEETKELDVIPIIGMVGIGKTTMALRIYNDPIIQSKFPTCIWVDISQELDIMNLYHTILKKFTQQDMSNKSATELALIVSKYLGMARYLLILDDVWDIEAWEQIRQILPQSNRKGKVLITTCNEKVASYASVTRDPFRLRMLNTEESWKLFKFKVRGKRTESFPELEPVARRVIELCQGLPLAIALVAGIISQRFSTISWEKVCDMLNSCDNLEKRVENIIYLTYSTLPTQLRDCFLYLVAFPGNYEIPVRKLTRLWIAEGFIQAQLLKSLENTAQEYLDELFVRRLLMADRISISGVVKTCRVPRFIYKFCQNQVRFAKRHVFVHSHVRKFLSFQANFRKTRSFLLFSKLPFALETKDVTYFTHPFKMVRVFDVNGVAFPRFPPELTKLIHLRHVALSGNFKSLPAAITNLWNLQILLVNTLSRELEIKADLLDFEHLRHFWTNVSTFLKKGKGKGGKNLQSLMKISPHCFTIDILKKVKNLTELGICGALPDSMCFEELHYLEKLNLKHVSSNPLPGLPQVDSFPANLKSLVLTSTYLEWRNMSVLGKLPNLEVLKLKDNAFVGDSWDVLDGCFGRLDVLSIDHSNIKYWSASDDSFVELRILSIKNCRKLEEVPLNLGKNLEELYMNNVTKFAVSCAKKMEHKKGFATQG